MVTIKITRGVRALLREYSRDGESVDATINRLLDDASDYMSEDMVFGDGSTNVNVSRDTMKRIKSYSVSDNESYGRILNRAYIIAKSLNNSME